MTGVLKAPGNPLPNHPLRIQRRQVLGTPLLGADALQIEIAIVHPDLKQPLGFAFHGYVS
jgi:hypothetical protein